MLSYFRSAPAPTEEKVPERETTTTAILVAPTTPPALPAMDEEQLKMVCTRLAWSGS